jgi:hypothetical protein
MLPNLAVLLIVLFGTALAGAFWIKENTLIVMMCTAVTVELARAMQYFYGSSKGSSDKDDTIAASNVALGASAPPGVLQAVLALPPPAAPPVPPRAPELKPDAPGAQPAGDMPADPRANMRISEAPSGAMRPTGAPRD